MSSSIDQRIVEMQFDNKEFESGIQTSLKSIKKLENNLQLKDSAKGFENLGKAANNVSFDGLTTGVMAVQQKFSAMEIVAITALQNIVNRAMAAGESLVKSLSLDQISAGFEKFSSKTTSVATLVAQGYNIDEVSAQLDRLNTFTDETSYNFTDMVANIAKFTATGKSLNESVTAMEGIANWAAMSGQNAQTASRAMYQLAQAMGAGVMRLEDYKSIQNASMDTDEFRRKCIDAAISLGTLKDNGNDTYSVVSKGAKATAFNVSQFTTQLTDGAWLTSDVMMTVFNDYSKAVTEIVDASNEKSMTVSQIIEEIHSKSEKEGISLSDSIKGLGYSFDEFSLKAFEAAQKARTFNDAIDSVKDAVSTGWMQTFEIIFGNANEATELWTDFANDLYEIFAEGGNARNEYLKQVLGDSKTFTQEQWDIVDQNDSANSALQKALMETAKEHGIAIDDMVNSQTSFRESLKQGWLTTDIFTETLKKFTSETTASTTDLTDKLTEYKKIASEVIRGDFGNGAARKKALADAGHDYATIQGIVNKMLAGTEIAVSDLGEEQLKAIGYTDEQVIFLQKLAKQAEETGTPINELLESMNRPTGRELVIDTMRNALHGLMTVITTVKTAWSEVFPAKSAEEMYSIISAINAFSQRLKVSDESADKLRRTLKGLFSIIGIVTDAVSALARRAFKILNAVLGDVHFSVLDYTASIGDNIVKLREWLKSNETLNKAIDTCVDYIADGIVKLKDWVKNNKTLNDILAKFNTVVGDSTSKIKNWVVEHKLVSTVLDKVSAGFSKLTGWITKAKDKFVTWFAAFKSLPIIQKAISAFGDIVEKVLNSAKQLLEDIKPHITDFFDKFKDLDGISFEDLKGLWESLKTDAGGALQVVIDKFSGINNAIDTFKQNVSDLASIASEKFSGLKNLIAAFQQFTTKGAKNVAIDKIISAGVGIGVIASLKKLSDVLSATKKMGANIGDSFVGVLGAVKNVLVAYQKDIEANSIIKIAVAIGILAGALWVVSTIPTERLIPAALAIGVLGSAMMGFASLITYLKGKLPSRGDNPLTSLSKSLKSFSIGFNAVALTTAILIVVKALKELEGVETEGLGKRVAALVGIFAALALVGIAMSKLGGNKFGSAVYLLAMAFSLKTVIKALNELEDYPLDDIWSSLGKMSLILGALALVCRAASGAKFGSAVSLIAAAFSIKMMVDVLAEIAKMPMEDILKGISALVPIMAMMALVNITTVAAGKGGDGGKSILLMAAGLYVMVEVIKNLASVSVEELAKGIAFLTAMSVILTLYSAASLVASANTNIAKQSAGFLGMAAGIAVLVGAIWAINQIGVNQCWQAMGVITAISVIFGSLMAVSKLATGSEKTIIALTACVAALTIMVVAISGIPSEDLTPAIIAIDSIMVCLSLMMAASNLAGKSLGTIAMLTLAVAAIGALLWQLSTIPNPESLLPIAESLSMVLIAITAAMAILSKVPVNGIGQGGLAIIAGIGVIVSIMEALGALMQFDMFSSNIDRAIAALGKIGTGIGEFIGGIIGGVLGGISNSLPKIGKNIALFITSLLPAIIMLNAVKQGAVDGAVRLAEAVIAITAGNFVSGILSFLSGGINYEKLKTQFTGLGEAVSAFADTTKNVKVYQVKNSADAVKILIETLDGISSPGGAWQAFAGEKDLGKFATNLVAFGTALAGYATAISDIDPDVVTRSAAAAQTLGDLENSVPPTGGKLQTFLGAPSLSEFGVRLQNFGSSLVGYSKAITGADGNGGVDSKAIQATEAACKMLVALETSLPPSNGKLQEFLGQPDLGTFGQHLTAFAAGMKDYSNALTENGGINTSAITDSEAACTMLVDIATAVNQLKGDGGWALFASNAETLGEFGEDIGVLGENLKTFADNIDGVDFDGMAKAVDNLDRLVGILQKLNAEDVNTGALTNLGYALNSFDPKSTFFDLFADAFDQMEEAGTTFVQKLIDGIVAKAPDLTTSITEITTKFITDAATTIQKNQTVVTIEVDNLMRAIETSITGHEPTITEAFNGLLNSIINKVKERNGDFTAAGMSDSQGYADGIQNNTAPAIAVDNMSTFAIQTINAKNSLFNASGNLSATALASGFAANTAPVTSVQTTMGNALLAVGQRDGEFMASGENSASMVSRGIEHRQPAVSTSAANVAQAGIDAINAKTPEYEQVGVYGMEGFLRGMKSMMGNIVKAAGEIAGKALEAAKNALGVASPSKKFRQIGVYVGEGFINGMNQMLSKVALTGADLGAEAMSSIEMALHGFADLLENGIDTEPTIRPVIDLSDVEAGLYTLNGLMSDRRTLALAGSVRNVNSAARQMSAPVSANDNSSANQNEPTPVVQEFNQYNYSPKALSRREIYRDTKNLFAIMKRGGKA